MQARQRRSQFGSQQNGYGDKDDCPDSRTEYRTETAHNGKKGHLDGYLDSDNTAWININKVLGKKCADNGGNK